jgi:hypothetical protein
MSRAAQDTLAHGIEQQAVGAGFHFCMLLVAFGDDADVPEKIL